jgi:hypothetical protein
MLSLTETIGVQEMVKNVREKKKMKLSFVGYAHCTAVRLTSEICAAGKQ